MKDVRWHQRLSNFNKALAQLTSAVTLAQSRKLSDLENQGLIQAFEFTYEFSWNLLKDYFAYQGMTAITGPRDAIREAFQKALVTNGDEWMEMLKSRNQTSHAYNLVVAHEIVDKVIGIYHSLFIDFQSKMNSLKDNE